LVSGKERVSEKRERGGKVEVEVSKKSKERAREALKKKKKLTAACAISASSSHSNCHSPEAGERSILMGRWLETRMKLLGRWCA
jgi:hypothetical protein